ncbi:unnamed protein product [Didymodactylos carnosus]|uniref:Uncharacterized protein n=1 Tax=Didymodactylos carnosus TaxID=1234261 RepID=A0A813SM65_9BILA|nr:unnamed protein product [Didymodactylos carnosus]CAF0938802.1 unnamed protein product [Didymodactylos carnosus]CAF3584055.1 unnamed protein product [Didymodactylos carnosus]CAF3714230.1 unnamed protein product [Didymodactylos carnosus]
MWNVGPCNMWTFKSIASIKAFPSNVTTGDVYVNNSTPVDIPTNQFLLNILLKDYSQLYSTSVPEQQAISPDDEKQLKSLIKNIFFGNVQNDSTTSGNTTQIEVSLNILGVLNVYNGDGNATHLNESNTRKHLTEVLNNAKLKQFLSDLVEITFNNTTTEDNSTTIDENDNFENFSISINVFGMLHSFNFVGDRQFTFNTNASQEASFSKFLTSSATGQELESKMETVIPNFGSCTNSSSVSFAFLLDSFNNHGELHLILNDTIEGVITDRERVQNFLFNWIFNAFKDREENSTMQCPNTMINIFFAIDSFNNDGNLNVTFIDQQQQQQNVTLDEQDDSATYVYYFENSFNSTIKQKQMLPLYPVNNTMYASVIVNSFNDRGNFQLN